MAFSVWKDMHIVLNIQFILLKRDLVNITGSAYLFLGVI